MLAWAQPGLVRCQRSGQALASLLLVVLSLWAMTSVLTPCTAAEKNPGWSQAAGSQAKHTARNSNSALRERPTDDTSPPVRTGMWSGLAAAVSGGLGLAWLAGLGTLPLLVGGVAALLLIGTAAAFTLRGRATRRPFGNANTDAPKPGTWRMPRSYSPAHVGNDASARPWESMGPSVPPQIASAAAAVSGPASLHAGLPDAAPEGFDSRAFLAECKALFTSLQAAWDRADVPSLRAMMTSSMLADIQNQLQEREHSNATPQRATEVLLLEAQLLDLQDLGDSYLASVEFSGMLWDDGSAGPNPLREVWNLSQAKQAGSRWLVAGLQAMH